MHDMPILLIPGLNCTALAFDGLVPALWPLGTLSIANHRRGNSMAAIASAILEDAPNQFALGGFSMGGYIAFEIMRQAPERVLALALMDTMARPDTAEQRANRLRQIAIAEAGGFESIPAANFPNTVHPDHVGDARLRGIHRQMALETGAQTFIAQQTAIIGRPDSTPDLAGIRCRTAVIVGEADAVTPVEAAREMAAAIPGAKLTVIAGAGHLAPIEQPERYAEAMVGWLRGR